MTEAPPRRPPLETNDTFDAPRLSGKLTQDGLAQLQADDSNSSVASHSPDESAVSSAVGEDSGLLLEPDSAGATDDDTENYDTITIDPDTIVGGSRGGLLERDRRASHGPGRPRPSFQANGNIRRKSEPGDVNDAQYNRRQSIQVRLQKTDKKGRYVLTADDPEIREILKKGIEREEAAAADASRRHRTRFRDLVFTRQFTTFDRQNPLSADSPFHGFFTLFWLAMVLMFLKVSATNWRYYGSILGRNEVMDLMFSRDVIVLGVTDVFMLLSTTFCLLLQKIIARGYLTWNRSGWIIQNVWQTCWLAGFIGWMFYRDWPWTHTIFMVLHTMVFLMKQHSYGFYNGYLATVFRRQQMLRRKLTQLKELKPSDSTSDSRPTSPEVAKSSSVDFASADYKPPRQQKNRPSILRTSTNLSKETSDVANVAIAIESGQALDASQKEAFERIIQGEIDLLDLELKGKCVSGANAYPKNLNLANFFDWTCLPTLVYELEYPRQDHINWWYVAEKTMATFGTIGVMMVISQAYIYPPVAETVRMKEAGMNLQERAAELPWIVSDMLFPLLLEQLLSWYVIWECVLNVLAEVTRFADRGFYGDWWNSVSWDQYARDWNRPVHNFLLRHVYHSSISTFHLSKSSATFVTFLLSALVHELVMACLFKKVRGYLLTTQLLQIPLVALSRSRLLKGRNLLGNVVFWIGLFVGPSVLTSFYLLI